MSAIRIRPYHNPALQVVLSWEPRYRLVGGEPGRPLPFQLMPFHVDIHDVARAHIRALELPPVSAGTDADRQQQKLFLVVSPDVVTWDLAFKHLRETRPALCNRLGSLADAATLPVPLSANDTTHTKEALGIMEYIPWRKMFDDTVEALLEAEKACA